MHTLFTKIIQQEDMKEFQSDCGRCFGLCCIGLYFSKMDGFPNDKPAHIACENLCKDFTCKTHASLLEKGYRGCLSYDCFGAGPITCKQNEQPVRYDSMSKEEKTQLFNAFHTVTAIQQTLWYMKISSFLSILSKQQQDEIQMLIDEGNQLVSQRIEVLSNYDTSPFQTRCNTILKFLSSQISKEKKKGPSVRIAYNFHHKDVAYMDFSMDCMIKADLSNKNLYACNVLGADMRDVHVEHSDLRNCLYLTQIQLNAMIGDASTQIPSYLDRPPHWPKSKSGG